MNKLPDINQQFAEWYQEIIYQAELADQSPVRGSYVIRPYGWSIWEHIKGVLDHKIKATGHENASFPLLIPLSFLQKEAEHIEGFAPEVAVVTHAGGKELEEPLVIRPTSETIIHYMFAQWIKSYRDLPVKINQWANVVRWEMRTRPFLRTTEFHWQEGHTVHETFQEAKEEAELMLSEYVDLCRNYLAIPAIAGFKSAAERFPGADETMTFEGLMQDGKALQMGTSHLLSQSFAKSFNIQFQDREGKLAYPYLTSWGTTTRLVGAVVMVHGDQKGLVLPPKIAPIQMVIVPIFKTPEDRDKILNLAHEIKNRLKDSIRIHIDAREEINPGNKYYHWEMKGVPLRLEIGPRDLAQNQVVLADRIGMGKKIVALDALDQAIVSTLDIIQQEMLTRATARRDALWFKEAKLATLGPKLDTNNGLYQTGWCQLMECEQELKQYKATTRCLLPDQKTFETCFNCDLQSICDVLVAKAY